MVRRLLLASATLLLAAGSVRAAEPIRIGITTILSGPFADRGQSEQYGAQLAIDQINEAGGVLGRPLEAYYADNACDPKKGVPEAQRLATEEHVPVIIGALCTPVTHAIMPELQQDRVPLLIATSAGQDFVDASGAGGDPYAWKTIPSEVDIARGLMGWLKQQGVGSVVVLADDNGFSRANAVGFGRAAGEVGIHVLNTTVVPQGTSDLGPIVTQLKALSPDRVVVLLGPSTGAFFKAYAAAGWDAKLTGRFDMGAALAALGPDRLAGASSVAVFSPLSPGVGPFVAAYRAHTGLVPTQRSFFVYEAVLLAADAIRRGGADTPEAVETALKTTTLPSAMGGSYAPDDHNHAHTPLSIIGVTDGKPALLTTVP